MLYIQALELVSKEVAINLLAINLAINLLEHLMLYVIYSGFTAG